MLHDHHHTKAVGAHDQHALAIAEKQSPAECRRALLLIVLCRRPPPVHRRARFRPKPYRAVAVAHAASHAAMMTRRATAVSGCEAREEGLAGIVRGQRRVEVDPDA